MVYFEQNSQSHLQFSLRDCQSAGKIAIGCTKLGISTDTGAKLIAELFDC